MRTQEEIIDAALELNGKARLEIACELLCTVAPPPDTYAMIRAAETVCGITLDSSCKDADQVDARCMIAFELNEAGLPDREVAAILNKKRVSVIYERNKMREALIFPVSNPVLVKRYAEFKKLLCD
jgi:hypothetical protein